MDEFLEMEYKETYKKLGYYFEGRELEWMREMIAKYNFPIELKLIRDLKLGTTGLTTMHSDGSATIELSNVHRNIEAIMAFLHELAHVEDAHNYWLIHHDYKKLKEHGSSWKEVAKRLGAPPTRTVLMAEMEMM